MESLKEILIDENPEIVGLTETMLDEADVIDIEGYTVHRNDRNGNGGGVLLAVKIDLKGLIVQECKDSEEGESQVQKSTAYTRLDCCCFNAAQIVLTPPAPRNGGPFLPFFGQAGQVDPLVGWRSCY